MASASRTLLSTTSLLLELITTNWSGCIDILIRFALMYLPISPKLSPSISCQATSSTGWDAKGIMSGFDSKEEYP